MLTGIYLCPFVNEDNYFVLKFTMVSFSMILQLAQCQFMYIIEPPQDKTSKMACAPSEESDQPGHPPSLIRVNGVAKDLSFLHVDIED